jgi:hypothetical protein
MIMMFLYIALSAPFALGFMSPPRMAAHRSNVLMAVEEKGRVTEYDTFASSLNIKKR